MSSASVQVAEEPIAAFTGLSDAPAVTPVPANDGLVASAFSTIAVGLVDAILAKRLELRRQAISVEGRASYHRAKALNAHAPTIPQAVTDKLKQAQKRRNKAIILRGTDAKGNAQAIKDHEMAARDLEIEADEMRKAAAEGQWAYGAVAETVALNIARGETVKTNRRGEIRITTRCGLTMAIDGGHLAPVSGKFTEAELILTAERYHDAAEACSGRKTSSGEGGSGCGAKGPQIKLVEAGALLVVLRQGLSAFQLSVMDAICGESQTISAVAAAKGRQFAAIRAALVEALQIATDNLAAKRAIKATAERMTKDRMEAAHKQITAALRSA
jgi:hypothetical protein